MCAQIRCTSVWVLTVRNENNKNKTAVVILGPLQEDIVIFLKIQFTYHFEFLHYTLAVFWDSIYTYLKNIFFIKTPKYYLVLDQICNILLISSIATLYTLYSTSNEGYKYEQISLV